MHLSTFFLFVVSVSIVVVVVSDSDSEEANCEVVDKAVVENTQTGEPRCCEELNSNTLAEYVVVSTLDGRLLALDSTTGSLVWETRIDEDALLSGTLAKVQPIISEGREFHLVPALDGSLYMYSKEERLLEPIPINTDSLLQASVRIGHDAIAGGKTISTIGVDPHTGEIRYHCSSAHCEKSSTDVYDSTLVFRKKTSAVRAVDALNGHERWNLTVSEFDATLIVDPSKFSQQYRRNQGTRYLFQPPDGVVTALDSCGKEMWSVTLGNHIAKTWKMESSHLEELSLFESKNIFTLAAEQELNVARNMVADESLFYLGTNNGQPFIMHSNTIKKDLQLAALFSHNTVDVTSSTQLARPKKDAYVISEKTIDDMLSISYTQSFVADQKTRDQRQIGVRGSTDLRIVSHQGDKGSCRNSNGKPLIEANDIRRAGFDMNENGDQGWFIFKPESQNSQKRISGPLGTCRNIQEHVVNTLDNNFYNWRKTFSVLFGILIGASVPILFFLFRRRNRPQIEAAAISRHGSNESAKSAETKSTLCGPSVDGSFEEQEPQPLTRQGTFTRKTFSDRNSSCETFQSKFLQDFEPVKLLGHGGFGVVFKANHRLDEVAYAVKRIAVANQQTDIQRVLREVRAMAKLDHTGIIRYYHTWIEEPPIGWQEETDTNTLKELNIKKRKRLYSGKVSMSRATTEVEESSISVKEEETGSIVAPDLPDGSTDGSWLDDESKEGKSTTDSSSDDSDSDDEDDASLKTKETTHGQSSGVIFESSSSKTREIVQLNPDLVLVTSVDEGISPSTETSNVAFLYIQMQLCQERTLHSWLRRHAEPSDRPLEQMKSWMLQLISAVDYIHSQGLIHRDVKPQNIFFASDSHLKIGDLGLVTNYGELQEEIACNMRNSHHTDNVGTRGYMSPEQLNRKPYTFKVDVFSLGLVFCELLIPFPTLMERSKTLGGLQRGDSSDTLDILEQKDKSMIEWMTHQDPDNRPSCREIIKSDYMRDYL